MADTTVNMPNGNPSRKVLGATAGATGGIIVANFIEWGLDDLLFQPKVPDSVPGPVQALVLYAVPIALTFLGGWVTKRSASEINDPPQPPPEHRADN